MDRSAPFPTQCLVPGADAEATPFARLVWAASGVAGGPISISDIALSPADAAALQTAVARHASRHTGLHVSLVRLRWPAFYGGLPAPRLDAALPPGTMRVGR